jgi:hypothetical protein
MNFMLSLDPQLANKNITYNDKLLLIGSCFSDNIGAKLQEAKFNVLYNPTGIVFDPLSLAVHLADYATKKQYTENDLFEHNELWHSWLHHSDFSSPRKEQTLELINQSILTAHQQVIAASHLFITLGTAFSYQLIEKDLPVANCHKAPKNWFDKRLLTIDEMVLSLQKSIKLVKQLNPTLEIVFTVSPVKHIRDGIIENSLSKARLLEVAHQLSKEENGCSYFPAYELVTDVLRDYRFYASDMAHPNAQAIEFVFEHFCKIYLVQEVQQLMGDVLQIVLAKKHKPLHTTSNAHQQFLKTFLTKTEVLSKKLSSLNWDEEIKYFTSSK